MGERFQVEKLNKDDHKEINNNTKKIKIFLGVSGAIVFVGTIVKKHGKDIVNIAKSIVSKK